MLGRPRFEVADILRTHGDEYRRAHKPSAAQQRVMRHLETCRTAALGGHRDTCGSCGHVRISYNSCRDRHCPKCQGLKRAEWLDARRQHLLPVPYFHVVFTIPDELNPLALRNKRPIFDLLFDTAARTLLQLTADPKHLGAEIGFTAILHSWGQNLLFHPHLHVLVAAGGLMTGGQKWMTGRSDFFLPVKVLGRLFRGKFLDALRETYQSGDLELKGSTEHLREPSAWQSLIGRLYGKDWVVYAKPPFGGAEHVLRYLGAYTHRVAISNHRIVTVEGDKVTFRIRDYTDGNRNKLLTLHTLEFIRRFLLHVLPARFVRIRHYGLCAARNVRTKLARAWELLEPDRKESCQDTDGQACKGPWWKRLLILFGIDLTVCPRCGKGSLVRTPLVTMTTWQRAGPPWDTS
jgi:hypothetical protein